MFKFLIDVAKAQPRLVAYANEYYAYEIKLSANGELISSAALPPKTTILAPSVGGRANVVQSGTGLDNFTYVFGAAEAGRTLSYTGPRKAAFASTVESLKDVHPALMAIHLFLQRGVVVLAASGVTSQTQLDHVLAHTPPQQVDDRPDEPLVSRGKMTEDARVLSAYAQSFQNAISLAATASPQVILADAEPSDRILFTVEGHPEWWLHPDVAKAHLSRVRDRTSGDSPAKPVECSMCGEVKPPARLFAQGVLRSSIVSFQSPAWSSYGREQGYNVPTCEECAADGIQGLDLLLESPHNLAIQDMRYLWWPTTGKLGLDLWSMLRVATGGITRRDVKPTDEQRAAALEGLRQAPDTFLMAIEKMQGRSPIRRLCYIPAGTVYQRVTRWLESGLGTVWSVVSGLSSVPLVHGASGEPYVSADEEVYWMERALLMLVGGERLSPRDANQVKTDLERSELVYEYGRLRFDSIHSRRRVKFLSYAGGDVPHHLEVPLVNGIPQEPNMSSCQPRERFAFYLGCAFQIAESVQRWRSSPLVTIRDTAMARACADPVFAYNLASEYISVRGKDGRATTSRRLTETLLRAVECIPDGVFPDYLNDREQLYFRLGDNYSRARSVALAKARQEGLEVGADEVGEEIVEVPGVEPVNAK